MKKRNPNDQRPSSDLEHFSYEGAFEYTYEGQNEPQAQPEAVEETPVLTPETIEKKRKSKQAKIFVAMLCLLAAFCLFLIVVHQTLFRLQNVYVVGVGEEYLAEVVTNSGLMRGQHMSTISEDQIRKNLDANNQIVFRDLQIHYPNTVYIYVEKRQRVAVLQWAGTLYELDGTGRVLSRQETNILPGDVPVVTGLGVTGVHVGQQVAVSNMKRLSFYCDLMYELDMQDFRSHVKVISLSSLDNAYLEIDNGMSVRLGSNEYIQAKIGAIRGSLHLADQMEGDLILNVSIPETPTVSVGIYRPNSAE
ncbi:MAG: hypothetical protein J6K72_00375 [Clostridia bacterium]|nr:hypothetical protein [Clostridia bacterium]